MDRNEDSKNALDEKGLMSSEQTASLNPQQESNANEMIYKEGAGHQQMYRVVQWGGQSYAIMPYVEYSVPFMDMNSVSSDLKMYIECKVYRLKNNGVTGGEQQQIDVTHPLQGLHLQEFDKAYPVTKPLGLFVEQSKKELLVLLEKLKLSDKCLNDISRSRQHVDEAFTEFGHLRLLNEIYRMISESHDQFAKRDTNDYLIANKCNIIEKMFAFVQSDEFVALEYPAQIYFAQNLKKWTTRICLDSDQRAKQIRKENAKLMNYLQAMGISSEIQEAILKGTVNIAQTELSQDLITDLEAQKSSPQRLSSDAVVSVVCNTLGQTIVPEELFEQKQEQITLYLKSAVGSAEEEKFLEAAVDLDDSDLKQALVNFLRNFKSSTQDGLLRDLRSQITAPYNSYMLSQKDKIRDYIYSTEHSDDQKAKMLDDLLGANTNQTQKDRLRSILPQLQQKASQSPVKMDSGAALERVLSELSQKDSDADELIRKRLQLWNCFCERVDHLRTIFKKNGVSDEIITKNLQNLVLNILNTEDTKDLERFTGIILQDLLQFILKLQKQFIVGELLSTDPKTAADSLQMSFLKEVVKEIDALKKEQEHKIAPNQENASDFGSVETTDYRARAHNDAQEEIRKLLDEQGFKRSAIGPANNCYHYSLLDTQFSLTDYLKNKPVDLREKFKPDQQEHFDDYNAAFAEAFTRYYEELHKHMKSHSTRSKQNGRTYYTVNRPQDSNVRGQDEFEFSFEKNPQKENIAVIDSEIKEMVSAYQTAFFILESMNSNKDLAQARYDALRKKFEGDIGELLKERAACIKKLPPDDLKKDIPQAPIYHVIASSERVLEVRESDTNEYLHEKDLKREEGYLKQIFSLQNMLNYLMTLMRGLQRYVSMLTSPHHAQLVFTGKIRAHNRTTAAFEQVQSSLQETQSLLDTERRNYPIPNKNKSI